MSSQWEAIEFGLFIFMQLQILSNAVCYAKNNIEVIPEKNKKPCNDFLCLCASFLERLNHLSFFNHHLVGKSTRNWKWQKVQTIEFEKQTWKCLFPAYFFSFEIKQLELFLYVWLNSNYDKISLFSLCAQKKTTYNASVCVWVTYFVHINSFYYQGQQQYILWMNKCQ